MSFDLSLCACAACGRREPETPLIASIEDVARVIADLAADVRRTEGALVQGIRRLHLASGREDARLEELWLTDALDALDAAGARDAA